MEGACVSCGKKDKTHVLYLSHGLVLHRDVPGSRPSQSPRGLQLYCADKGCLQTDSNTTPARPRA